MKRAFVMGILLAIVWLLSGCNLITVKESFSKDIALVLSFRPKTERSNSWGPRVLRSAYGVKNAFKASAIWMKRSRRSLSAMICRAIV